MTASGVQNIDSSAYLPPPSASPSPDAKGAQARQAQGESSNFQNEFALQQTGTQDTDPSNVPKTVPKTGPAKADTGKPSKPGKTSDKRADDSNLSAVTPPQLAEPQKQILPLVLALPQLPENDQPQENARLDENAYAGEKTAPPQVPLTATAQPLSQQAVPTPLAAVAPGTLPKQILQQLQEPAPPQATAKLDENAKADEKSTPEQATPVATDQALSQQAVPAPLASLPAGTLLTQVRQPGWANRSSNESPKQSAKLRQSATSVDRHVDGHVDRQVDRHVDGQPASAANAAPLTLGLPLTSEVPEPSRLVNSDQVTSSAKSGASSGSQPVSPADLKLPATPAEPGAAPVQETADSPPLSPSALAFAARLATASQKAVELVQSLAVSGSQTAVQIPLRHAATAQIIQSATMGTQPGTQPDGPKEDASAFLDKSASPSDRTGARTDMVLPRFETVSASSSSGSAAPQQAAPAARTETIIEPPAAPPVSSHDIRVRVPDNNGGSTQVRFVESGGEVRVSVRTADESLAQNLRTHLNDLTQRLSDGGISADMWKPASNAASSQNDSHANQNGANQDGANQDGRGSGGQGSGGQGGQQDRQQKRPAWLEEMEASLHGEPN